MGRMRIGMASIVLILLLFILIVAFGFITLTTYKSNYKTQNLLRIDPLGNSSLPMETIGAVLGNADIWMLGDSRIGRWNQELLAGDIKFANLGIEGQTSSQVYYRFKNYLEIDTPELVIVEVGINDLKVIGLDKNLAKSITDNYYGNIEAMISLCAEKGIKMLLINIFPVGRIELLRRLIWNRHVNETIREANDRLKSYCDNNHVFYFDAYTLLADNGETVNPEYQADFLHINKRGYEVLSRELIKQINIITGKE